jgi:hypothetical protein
VFVTLTGNTYLFWRFHANLFTFQQSGAEALSSAGLVGSNELRVSHAHSRYPAVGV